MNRSLPPHPTWIEIDLSAIEDNTRWISDLVKVPLMAVVKDDGYGHGAVQVARSFLKAGGIWLGVARGHEGVELRQAGIEAPILILGGILPEEAEMAVHMDLTVALYDMEMIDVLSNWAKALGKPAKVHIKIDTGMGRFGFYPDEVLQMIHKVNDSRGIIIDGVFSHFASAGDNGPLTELQLNRFYQALDIFRQAGATPRWNHIANSSAIIAHPEARFNLVRAGGILYGLNFGSLNSLAKNHLRHAFSWKARLMAVRAMGEGWTVSYGADYTCGKGEIIGVVPVGHGDGFRRMPGNEVLIGGRRVPVVGSVCMDQFMVSLPEKVDVGSEVVLVGRQGEEWITPEEVRNRWKSTYSGVFLVHPRVPRIFH
jgi:alanine racemase